MKISITAIIVMLGLLLAILLLPIDEEIVVYDCGIAEWHPNVPEDVKEECRKRIREYLENERLKKYI